MHVHQAPFESSSIVEVETLLQYVDLASAHHAAYQSKFDAYRYYFSERATGLEETLPKFSELYYEMLDSVEEFLDWNGQLDKAQSDLQAFQSMSEDVYSSRDGQKLDFFSVMHNTQTKFTYEKCEIYHEEFRAVNFIF